MISDPETWACAHQLMKQHGADAWFVASRRADELLAAGDDERVRVFLRVLARIRDLETVTPTGRAQ